MINNIKSTRKSVLGLKFVHNGAEILLEVFIHSPSKKRKNNEEMWYRHSRKKSYYDKKNVDRYIKTI